MSVKSLYGQYIEAREGFEILESEHGFITYKITGDECYVRDIFVERAHRKEGLASLLCDRVRAIAAVQGCKWLTGSVQPSVPGSTESLKVVLAYGFSLVSAQPDFIILKMGV